jgi:hypothetical protein
MTFEEALERLRKAEARAKQRQADNKRDEQSSRL